MLWKFVFRPLLALAIFVLLAAATAIAVNRPPLLEEPGIGVRTWTYLSQNRARTGDIAAFPELRTRRYQLPPERVFEAAQAAAQQLGWEVVDADPRALRLYAVDESRIWRMQEQIEVAVGELDEGGSRVFMQAHGQFGFGDFGASARRIVDFHEVLERRL